MRGFAALIESLVWPVGLAVLLLWNRAEVARIVSALTQRIEEGAPLKAGGLEIGAAPSLPAVPKEEDPRQVDSLPHDIYMVHSARRARTLDTADHEYFGLRISLDADDPGRLDQVATV